MSFEGKIALVTGASRGIGRAIAETLVARGAKVIGTATSESGAQAISDYLGANGKGLMLNVTDPASIESVLENVRAEFGEVDILVNNAGITNDKLLIAMKEEDFDSVLNTNLKGAFNMTKHVGAYLLKQRKGRIINISSVSGLMGNVGQCNYAAAKAGLIGLTKSAAKEMALRGVTCNAIAPGFIDTDMTKELKPEIKAEILKQIPLKRLGQADDIANLCVYLSSDLSGYITGEVIKVDGGLYI